MVDLTKAGEPENSNHAYTVVSPSNHVTNSKVMCSDKESFNNNCTDSSNVISESTKMVTRDDDLFLLGAADIISTLPQPDEGVKSPDFGNDHCLMIANDDTMDTSIRNMPETCENADSRYKSKCVSGVKKIKKLMIFSL